MAASQFRGVQDDEILAQLPAIAEFRFQLRTFISFSEQRSESLGITAQQYQMLQVIAGCGAAGCSISDLAARLLLRHNSAVELVDRGERSGLVQRTADPSDLRRSLLRMTARGNTVLRQLLAEHVRYLQQDGPVMIEALLRITSAPLLKGHAT